MMRNSQALLKYEMQKKPEIADIFDRIKEYSKEEINEMKFPKWIRKALIEERYKPEVRMGVNPDILGEVRRWNFGDTFIQVDRGGSVEITTGKLLFFPKNGGVWIDTLFSAVVDQRLAQTVLVQSEMMRMAYIQMYRDELAQRFPNAPVMLDLTTQQQNQMGGVMPGGALDQLSAYGVRKC
jgi:hypothetical protein